MMTPASPAKIMILWILFQLNEELVELRVCLTSLFALIIEPMEEFPEFWQVFPFFLGGKVLPVVESFSIMWFWALWQHCFFFSIKNVFCITMHCIGIFRSCVWFHIIHTELIWCEGIELFIKLKWHIKDYELQNSSTWDTSIRWNVLAWYTLK